MSERRFIAPAARTGMAALALLSCAVCAQNYPTRSIRIICAEPGASNDFLARIIAREISEPLGQQVIVDNRASALIDEAVARSAPDGYTLLITTGGVWTTPFLRKTAYDPVKDLTPITLAVTTPNVLVVHPSMTVNSVRELIALAKARPGELNYASGTAGSASHLAGELFVYMAGIKIMHVPYKGAGPAVTALVGGQVQMMVATSTSVAPHIKSGKLKALAVGSAKPSEMFPTLPTISASGVPGYEAAAILGVFAPAATPVAIINRLNQVIVSAMKRPETKDRLFGGGMEIVGSSPEQSVVMIKADMERIGKLIKDVGIRSD